MVLAAAKIPEVEAESEAGDDHAGKAHGNENYGPHVTIASVVSLFNLEGLATTEKFLEQIDIYAAFSSD